MCNLPYSERLKFSTVKDKKGSVEIRVQSTLERN